MRDSVKWKVEPLALLILDEFYMNKMIFQNFVSPLIMKKPHDAQFQIIFYHKILKKKLIFDSQQNTKLLSLIMTYVSSRQFNISL